MHVLQSALGTPMSLLELTRYALHPSSTRCGYFAHNAYR